ncbi:four-carbon acid sugar kinase family protein [Micromonospora sp. DT81.3]|uniref:four-carbon acid sugar kinase family protein n=1 Tax=Micromonospora sp. DT81.3 TaxID=3416523 RepID=UPI003CF54C5D
MSDGGLSPEGVAGARRGKARVGFYGDDFTGSVDALLQFARRGWTGRLFTSVPTGAALAAAAAEVDVVGIAGIARSLPTAGIEDELRPALEALRDAGAHVVQYKASSTADSSPTIGSLGRVAEIAREVIAERPVPVLFAQPDFGRYTVFGHHFAAEDGMIYRLDRQPTMSTHPSTPMTDSDLRVHLSRQTSLEVGGIPLVAYDENLDERLADGDALVVLDALTDEHLIAVGAAIWRMPEPVFAIGSGGLSHGLAAADAHGAPPPPVSTPATGPVLAVSGSRSRQTRRQADAAADAGWLVRPLPLGDGYLGDGVLAQAISDTVAALGTGRSVAFTSDDADTAGVVAPLEGIARAAASIIERAAAAGVTRRIIVCGGDTSSRVTRLLGIHSLSIAANPWGNVVLLRAHAEATHLDGLELLLKGGQVGTVTLFDDVRRLGA